MTGSDHPLFVSSQFTIQSQRLDDVLKRVSFCLRVLSRTLYFTASTRFCGTERYALFGVNDAFFAVCLQSERASYELVADSNRWQRN